MFTTTKKNTHSKRLACPMALQYGLKDLPCSTEGLIFVTNAPANLYGAISSTMRAIKNARKSRLKHKY